MSLTDRIAALRRSRALKLLAPGPVSVDADLLDALFARFDAAMEIYRAVSALPSCARSTHSFQQVPTSVVLTITNAEAGLRELLDEEFLSDFPASMQEGMRVDLASTDKRVVDRVIDAYLAAQPPKVDDLTATREHAFRLIDRIIADAADAQGFAGSHYRKQLLENRTELRGVLNTLTGAQVDE